MRQLLYILTLFCCFCLAGVNATAAQKTLRIAVEQNPPLSYFDSQKRPAGLSVDLLHTIAGSEGWQLQYVACAWDQCLEKLKNGDVDLIATIAYSKERAQQFDFNSQTVINLWGQLYTTPRVSIDSFLKLEGKRIAVVPNDTHHKTLATLLERFGVKARFVEAPSFVDVFQAIEAGRADAGVVGRFFGLQNEEKFKVRPSTLIFNPIEVRFAATKGKHVDVLLAIDNRLAAMKADRSSTYYTSLDTWLGVTQQGRIPDWLKWAGFGGIGALFLAAGTSMLLRRQVKQRTAHLEQEIAERKKYEAQLFHQASYDSLTGLPNRSLLMDRLINTMVQAERKGEVVPLVLLDLDNFKYVNDSMGHDVGDQLLCLVAHRLQGAVRESDTVSRWAGDEFVVAPSGQSGDDGIAALAEKLLELFKAPFELQDREFFITVSMGIALFPKDSNSPDELLKHADTAMYHAKKSGKNSYQFFTEDLNQRIHDRLAMEHRLRRALERGEFLLHYQPQIEVTTGRISGVEALLRWQTEDEGMQSPLAFVPLLEETGLIIPVGQWVLETACRQLQDWIASGLPPFSLSINVSTRQFADAGFVPMVLDVIEQTGIDPALLRLEITESLLMEDLPGLSGSMEELSDRKITLSIDDFGTGYSNLSYLGGLPISELKIDRSFIRSMKDNHRCETLVNAIFSMAEALEMRVVAEGVETADQYHLLATKHCHDIQGFYFSKPLAPEALSALVRAGIHLPPHKG